MPKFVASRSLAGALEWNATLIEGDALNGVEKLKPEHDGDLVLIGCGDLARQLLERGLIDELRFWVHPAMWGSGSVRSRASRADWRCSGRGRSTRVSHSFAIGPRSPVL